MAGHRCHCPKREQILTWDANCPGAAGSLLQQVETLKGQLKRQQEECDGLRQCNQRLVEQNGSLTRELTLCCEALRGQVRQARNELAMALREMEEETA